MSWHTEPELRKQKHRQRFDTTALASVDLRRYLDWQTFKRARRGEWHGACPKCGGKDRFILQERDGYKPKVACRQCTGTDAGCWMDAIAFMQWLHGCDFVDACQRLQLRTIDAPANTPQRRQQQAAGVRIPAADSRVRGAAGGGTDKKHTRGADSRLVEIARRCAGNLDSDTLRYLRGRGIDSDTAAAARLGVSRGIEMLGLFVPAGLTIPCWRGDSVAYIKVRTADGYKQVAGGKAALYRAPLDSYSGFAIVTETELDALMLSLIADANCYATGSVSWNANAAAYLARQHKLMTAFDNDDAGQEAAYKWRAPKLRIPADCKDIGEVYGKRGAAAIRGILQAAGIPARMPPDCAVSRKRPRSRDMPQNRPTGLLGGFTGELADTATFDPDDLDTPKSATGRRGLPPLAANGWLSPEHERICKAAMAAQKGNDR